MNIFQNFFGCQASKKRLEYNLTSPVSYHLPEGRYYEAPLILLPKRSRLQHIFPLILGAGISIIGLSTVQKQNPQFLTTETKFPNSINADQLLASKIDFNADRIRTALIKAHKNSGMNTDEQRINRKKKQSFMTRNSADLRFALAEKHLNNNLQELLSKKLQENHMSNLAFVQKPKINTSIALNVVPVPQKKEVATLPIPKILASLVTNEKPDILALSYISRDSGTNKETPFDSILTDEDKLEGRFIPPIGRKDHSWAAMPLPPISFTAKEQKCLAEAIYFEARSEALKGQAAVAQVVLNRVRNPAYPTTICGVVYQNVTWRNRCQFSFACDGKKHYITEKRHWRIAQDVAKTVSAGQIWLPDIGSSTHYHASYVRPNWANSMYKMKKIGLHVFYRTKNGGLG